MKKEFVLASQFAGLSSAIAYLRIPIISDFYIVAAFLIWKYCGWKYVFLYMATVELMILPLTITSLYNSISIWNLTLTNIQQITKKIISLLPAPSQVHQINPILGIFALIGFLIFEAFQFYGMYKGIRKFFQLLADIQKRVSWTRSPP